MNRLIAVLAIALSVSGCAGTLPSFKNPISNTALYEAELAFDGGLKTFNELRRLCVNRTIPAKCRTYVLAAQGYIAKAYAADTAAQQFVTNNPTLDPTNVVQAFVGIVSNFTTTVNNLGALK